MWANARGVARNSFWVGIIFLLHDTTVLYTSSLTTLAVTSAQNNLQGLILGGYIYRYTPVATPLANAQRDGRPAEHRWRPLFNSAKCG